MVGKRFFHSNCFSGIEMEFSKMVREVPELFVDPEVQEPRRLDFSGEPEFPRQTTGTDDLVNAFGRFCSTRTGSFERLVSSWAQGRLRVGLPVNLDEPACRSIAPRLKKALQAGFERSRKRRKK